MVYTLLRVCGCDGCLYLDEPGSKGAPCCFTVQQLVDAARVVASILQLWQYLCVCQLLVTEQLLSEAA